MPSLSHRSVDIRRRLVLLAILGLVLTTSSASAEADDSSQQLFDASGVEVQLAALGPQILAALDAERAAMTRETHTAVRKEVANQFGEPSLREHLLNYLRTGYDSPKANAAIAWLVSPTGKRIAELEQAIAEPDGLEELDAFGRSLQDTPPSAKRVELISGLEQATRATALSVDTSLNAALALAVSINASSEAPRDFDELRSGMVAQRDQMIAATRDPVLFSMLFAYRDLGDKELAGYVEFARSDAGTWYHATLSQSIVGSLRDATVKLDNELRASIPKEKAL